MENIFMPHVDKTNDGARFLGRYKGWFQSIGGGDSFGDEHVPRTEQVLLNNRWNSRWNE